MREQVRPAGRDPAARPGAEARRRRPSSPRRSAREGYDAVQTTVSRDIAQLGLVKVRDEQRPPRLRAAGRGRPRPARRADVGAPPLRAVADADRQPARHPHAAGPRARARARARRRGPRRRRRHGRRRRHDLRRRARGLDGRDSPSSSDTTWKETHELGTAVLAYSGGLDTSCAIAWLKEDYGFDEVVAVLVDVGQDADFEPAIARGYAAGASDVAPRRPQERVRARAGREGAARERALRGQLPARLGALAAGDRGGRRRDRARARRRGGRPRLHGQGQRPAPLRARLQGEATPACA